MTLEINTYKALHSWETGRNKKHGSFCGKTRKIDTVWFYSGLQDLQDIMQVALAKTTAQDVWKEKYLQERGRAASAVWEQLSGMPWWGE